MRVVSRKQESKPTAKAHSSDPRACHDLRTASGCAEAEPAVSGRKRGRWHDFESARPRRRHRPLTLRERQFKRVLKDASARFEEDCARRQVAKAGGGRIDGRERSRGIAVLVMMTRHYEALPTTFALAVSLFDRFLEARACCEVHAAPDACASSAPTPTASGSRPDHSEGALAASSSAAGAAGIAHLAAPLSCLMMAIKFLEVRAPSLSDVLSSANYFFNILCVEPHSSSPPGSPGGMEAEEAAHGLGSLSPVLPQAITEHDLREWEKFVWQALGHKLDDVTAVDVLQGLVERNPSVLAVVQEAAERKLKAAMCAPRLRHHSPIDLAVAALLLSADRGADGLVTREQVQEALPSRLVRRPSLAPSLNLLANLLHQVYANAQLDTH